MLTDDQIRSVLVGFSPDPPEAVAAAEAIAAELREMGVEVPVGDIDCPPESPEVVDGLQAELGVRFPSELRRTLAVRDEPTIRCPGSFLGDQTFEMFAVRTPHYEYVSSTISDKYNAFFKEHNPAIIPIGADESDYLVLDYRKHSDPAVLMWDGILADHTGPFLFLARSFEEFICRGLRDQLPLHAAADEQLNEGELTEFLGFSAKPTFAYRAGDRDWWKA